MRDRKRKEGHMTNRVKSYLDYVDSILDSNSPDIDYDEEIAKHLTQITFFMHERLIHLIVTVLFAILTVITCLAFIITENIALLLLAIAFMVLLIPYIKHYYLLENSVQYMYEQYDEMTALAGKRGFGK